VDEPLLAHATLGNLNWREQRFTEHDVKSRSDFRHYTQLVLERGDFGFVAERAGEQIGVAWAQFVPSSDPGYGFLDESTLGDQPVGAGGLAWAVLRPLICDTSRQLMRDA
jgi:hypothetical protein